MLCGVQYSASLRVLVLSLVSAILLQNPVQSNARSLKFVKLPIASATSTAVSSGCSDGSCSDCFAKTSLVETPLGKKEMQDLRLGDYVRTMNKDGNIIFSPIFAFSSRRPHKRATYLRITTVAGQSILVTPGHYMFMSARGGHGASSQNVHTWPYVPASKIQKGDLIPVIAKGEERLLGAEVLNVTSETDTGVYMPHTASGAILVDGVFATELSTFVPTMLASSKTHTMLVNIVSFLQKIGCNHHVAAGLSYWVHGASDAVMSRIP